MLLINIRIDLWYRLEETESIPKIVIKPKTEKLNHLYKIPVKNYFSIREL